MRTREVTKEITKTTTRCDRCAVITYNTEPSVCGKCGKCTTKTSTTRTVTVTYDECTCCGEVAEECVVLVAAHLAEEAAADAAAAGE
jgi:ribosomal protein L37E